MIVTFYSYKGGVGRSMAMVNVAEVLADVGYDVILCDFDLEAPGLERYVTDDLDTVQGLRAGHGVMDLLEEYRQTMANSGPGQPEREAPPVPDDFRDINGLLVRRPSSYAVHISSPNTGRLGRVRFLSAGRRDGSRSTQYSEWVQQFDWSDFYSRWAGAAYVDFFRQDLTEGQAIVLVDSRTGVTEHSGICTHHLADLVVLLSAPNDLNIDGTKWMASTLAAADLGALRGGRPIHVMPVASRVETASEVEQLAAFRERFEREFADVVPAAAGDAREFIQKSEIPYIPYFAFTEKVVARQNVLLHRELYAAYEALAQAVVKVGLDAGMLMMPQRRDWLGPLDLGTAERISSGLDRERAPAGEPAVRRAKFVNPPPTVVPSWFQNRYVETQLIGEFLRGSELRLLTVVGRGGVGKTALVCRVLKALEGGRLPDDLGELPVDAIVYLSPAGTHPVSFPNLFADLTRVLPDAAAQRLQRLYRDPQQTPGQLMLALLEAFPAGRTIVLLDNLEYVIDPATQRLSDAAMDDALGVLLTAPQHGIKVIATTRLVPRELLVRHPGRARRLDLDEGLPVSEATNVLRALDRDGSLGLRDASPDLLAAACERTRGFPRALEALCAILAADRGISLPDLLSGAQDVLPDNVVEVLVGEAFGRLDLLGQEVMQALAIYAIPVPPVAVDYLLQPFQPTIDSSPVLSRLVNMLFARRDAGRYYLHLVDRDYALGRIPAGQRADEEAGQVPFTRYALRYRAADYFEKTRLPRESWRSLDDLAPQLNEFDQRCANADYDAAASVLADIDSDYLQRWGHYRLAADLHERLNGRLTDPQLQMTTAGVLADSYWVLGQTERAIELYQQALAIAHETGNRGYEGYWLGCLGSSYSTVGQTDRAIEYLQQAIAIARETGDRRSESLFIGDLGGIRGELGQSDRAAEHYQQALAIAREIGDRRSEGLSLGGLGGIYADMGQSDRAAEHLQQALAIAREIGDRRSEGLWLGGLGGIYADMGQSDRAAEHYDRAAVIGEDTEDAQVQTRARLGLAQVHLYREEWAEARQVAEDARLVDYLALTPQVFIALGTAYLCEGDRAKAEDAFSTSVSAADRLLANTHGVIHLLYAKGIACAGRALMGKPDETEAARRAFDQALAIAPAPGVRARTLRQLDVLATADADGVLAELRQALVGST